ARPRVAGALLQYRGGEGRHAGVSRKASARFPRRPQAQELNAWGYRRRSLCRTRHYGYAAQMKADTPKIIVPGEIRHAPLPPLVLREGGSPPSPGLLAIIAISVSPSRPSAAGTRVYAKAKAFMKAG